MVYRKLVQNLLHKSGPECYSAGTFQFPMPTQYDESSTPQLFPIDTGDCEAIWH